MIVKYLRAFEPRPKFYGLSYCKAECLLYVCHPIPLNLIFRFFHELHIFFIKMMSCQTKWEKRMFDFGIEQRKNGYLQGHAIGYELGLSRCNPNDQKNIHRLEVLENMVDRLLSIKKDEKND